MGEDDGLDGFLAIRAEFFGEGFNGIGDAPFRFDAFALQAKYVGHVCPALAKFAVDTTEDAIAGAEEVNEARFHCPSAASGKDKHVILGLVQPAQFLGDVFNHG